jgi:hypothetical protein
MPPTNKHISNFLTQDLFNYCDKSNLDEENTQVYMDNTCINPNVNYTFDIYKKNGFKTLYDYDSKSNNLSNNNQQVYMDNLSQQAYMDNSQQDCMDNDSQQAYMDNSQQDCMDNDSQQASMDNNSQQTYMDNLSQQAYMDNNSQQTYMDNLSQQAYMDNNSQQDCMDNDSQQDYMDNDSQQAYMDNLSQQAYMDNLSQQDCMDNEYNQPNNLNKNKQTYKCLNGKCQNSTKKYDPQNNVYNSYECKKFCHPAIPYLNSTFNIYKKNGFKTLSNYDQPTNFYDVTTSPIEQSTDDFFPISYCNTYNKFVSNPYKETETQSENEKNIIRVIPTSYNFKLQPLLSYN